MPERTCSVEECDRKHFARGLCKRHYSQLPEQVEKARASDRARRSTPEARARDKERLSRRRREQGVPERQRLTEAERAARRRMAKHLKAKRRLERAARGTSGTRTWTAGPCAYSQCRQHFVGHGNALCCSRTCRLRLERRKRKDTYGNGSYRRRARQHGVKYEPVDRKAVFKRDGYRCQICRRKTRGRHWLATGRPNPLSPTLDHIVPMACGGDHVLSNVQCACFECNCKKGDRAANEQMLLNVGAFV